MKDQWYGDNRDLVKWGVLLTLQKSFNVGHVLQVLYLRPSVWGKLEIDGKRYDLPDAVRQHFRSAGGVAAIECEVPVEVVEDPFMDRGAYLVTVLERIRSRSQAPGLVLLDPDTGLESRSPSPKHVLDSELFAIWSQLLPGDILVFYQHQTNRGGTPWIERKKSQFERAIGLAPGTAKLAWSAEIARDVAFFFAQKSDPRSPVRG